VSISQGFYFLHSTEICLLGVKKDPDGRFLEFMQKVHRTIHMQRQKIHAELGVGQFAKAGLFFLEKFKFEILDYGLC